jgi:hypothetical protein
MAAKWVSFQYVLHKGRQTIKAFAHIGVTGA